MEREFSFVYTSNPWSSQSCIFYFFYFLNPNSYFSNFIGNSHLGFPLLVKEIQIQILIVFNSHFHFWISLHGSILSRASTFLDLGFKRQTISNSSTFGRLFHVLAFTRELLFQLFSVFLLLFLFEVLSLISIAFPFPLVCNYYFLYLLIIKNHFLFHGLYLLLSVPSLYWISNL